MSDCSKCEHETDCWNGFPPMCPDDESLTETVSRTEEYKQIIDDLISLGYPHNFQHERSDIVEYMYAVTRIIEKAYKIKE